MMIQQCPKASPPVTKCIAKIFGDVRCDIDTNLESRWKIKLALEFGDTFTSEPCNFTLNIFQDFVLFYKWLYFEQKIQCLHYY